MANRTNITGIEGRILIFDTTPFVVSEISGDSSAEEITNNSFVETLDCDVWGSPSRAALQAIMLLMILLNMAAAVVVFGVPVNVRGRHVAFLFICVRTLNILDLLQCAVIFFFPLGMPKDCLNPNSVYCNISGFCFMSVTILSPLVAIVMAVDRFIAVFFHVRYKAKPQTKLKCACLAMGMGIYCFYFTLPMYTSFGEYIAVPWLSLCSVEWGKVYRVFNLILYVATALLTFVLMAANLAILIKVRSRKKYVERLKSSAHNTNEKRGISMKRLAINGHKSALFRKSKSVDDLSRSPGKEKLNNSNKSLSERRGRRVPPLSIIFSGSRHSSFHGKNKSDSVGKANSPDSPNTVPIADKDDEQWRHMDKNFPHAPGIFSPPPISPLTHDSALLFPPSPESNSLSPELYRPPSPLILGDGGLKPSPRMVTKYTAKGRNRMSSVESLLDGKEYNLSTFGHKQCDSNELRKKAIGNMNPSGKRNASSEPFLDRSPKSKSLDEPVTPNSLSSSTANSLFSSFIGHRLMSWRSKTSKPNPNPNGMKRNVSRITKMTTAICTLFAILYVPYMIRKIIQVAPEEYVEVPLAVEILTLFAPLLSPLFNPILYVFFNPHYREKCKRLYRRCSTCFRKNIPIEYAFNSSSAHGKSLRWRTKGHRKHTHTKKVIEMHEAGNSKGEMKHSADDVFLSTGKHNSGDGVFVYDNADHTKSPPNEDTRRRQSLRQLHLRRIQTLQFKRVNSEDYLN